jgi:hypothetical protein
VGCFVGEKVGQVVGSLVATSSLLFLLKTSSQTKGLEEDFDRFEKLDFGFRITLQSSKIFVLVLTKIRNMREEGFLEPYEKKLLNTFICK